MALQYEEPVMTCDGVEETVEHVWAKYQNTSGAIREHYFHELTLHELFYPCKRLRAELRRAALTEGYKRYEKTPKENGEWGNQQPLNYMLVAEVDYMETNFATSKMENKTAPIDRRRLYGWIKNNFRPDNRQKFEWYALWLLLKDKHLVKDNDLTLFAKQMVAWFPSQFSGQAEAEAKSLAKAVRIYKRILGPEPLLWKENEILSIIHDPKRGAGASEEGYKKIKTLFFILRSQLTIHNIVCRE